MVDCKTSLADISTSKISKQNNTGICKPQIERINFTCYFMTDLMDFYCSHCFVLPNTVKIN